MSTDHVFSATSTRLWNTSRDGDSTTSLGSLCHCITALLEKRFFLISDLTPTWSNLRPLPLILPLLSGRRGQLPPHPKLLSGHCREQWGLPWASARLNNPSSLSRSTSELCSRPLTAPLPFSGHAPGPPYLVVRGPKLNTALEVQPHECQVQSPQKRHLGSVKGQHQPHQQESLLTWRTTLSLLYLYKMSTQFVRKGTWLWLSRHICADVREQKRSSVQRNHFRGGRDGFSLVFLWIGGERWGGDYDNTRFMSRWFEIAGTLQQWPLSLDLEYISRQVHNTAVLKTCFSHKMASAAKWVRNTVSFKPNRFMPLSQSNSRTLNSESVL